MTTRLAALAAKNEQAQGEQWQAGPHCSRLSSFSVSFRHSVRASLSRLWSARLTGPFPFVGWVSLATVESSSYRPEIGQFISGRAAGCSYVHDWKHGNARLRQLA